MAARREALWCFHVFLTGVAPKHTFCKPTLLILVTNASKTYSKRPADSVSVGKVSQVFRCTEILVHCTENRSISCTMYRNYPIMSSFFLYIFLISYTFSFLMKCTRISHVSCTMYRNMNKKTLFFVQCTSFFVHL